MLRHAVCIAVLFIAAQVSCAYINEELLSWSDAAEACRSGGGHLAYPANQSEADEMIALLAASSIDTAHAGLHDLFQEAQYTTILGEAVSEQCYNQWSVDNPVGGMDKNCGALTSGGLIDVDCSELNPSICSEPLPTECSQGSWSDFELLPEFGYYKIFEDSLVSWADAVTTCMNLGTHLLVLNSDAELAALTEKYNFFVVWVGVHHIHQDQQFLTVYDTPLNSTGFAGWSEGEPSGTNIEYPYVGVTDEGLFIEGDREFHFICKHAL